MKITFLLGTFWAGGAERVVALLSGAFARSGHEVTVLTLDGVERDFYALDSNVRRVGLDLLTKKSHGGAKLRDNFRRVARLRALLQNERPDVLVSFIAQANVLALIAAVGLAIPVVIAERTDPRVHREPIQWRFLRWCMYRRACYLVVQTKSVCAWAERLVGKERAIAIPNPVLVDRVPPSDPEVSVNCSIVAMGQLARHKGFDLLVDAFSSISKRFPSARLVIYGDGPEREALRQHAGALGLTDRVSLPGQVSRSAEALMDASLFVLPSRYEGFPNVLIEAMALARPVVAFDCPSGPGEIVTHEVDGLLVPANDVAALGAAMARALSDSDLRRRISAKAAEVNQRFSLPLAQAAWEDVFDKAVQYAKRRRF